MISMSVILHVWRPVALRRNWILSQLTEKRRHHGLRAARGHGLRSRCAAKWRGGNWSTLRSQRMIWEVGKVEKHGMGSGFNPSPGFPNQPDGRSASAEEIFEDLKTAEQCASAMREIIDKATAIRGRD